MRGSIVRPPSSDKGASGTKLPEKITQSHGMRRLPSSVRRTTASTVARPTISSTSALSSTGTPNTVRAIGRAMGSDSTREPGSAIATTFNPQWRAVRRTEKATCSEPITTARGPGTGMPRVSICCNAPVVSTPRSGRAPGTSRAARGRSRTPVATSTAFGRISRKPVSGPTTRSTGPGTISNTVVRGWSVARERSVSPINRRMKAEPFSSRCEYSQPNPRCPQ